MKKQMNKTLLLILMLFSLFTLSGCQSVSNEVTNEASNFEMNIETLGEFESDPEFEDLMKKCEIPKNSRTNELEKEILSYSNDEVVLLNFSNLLYTAFVFENDVFQRSEIYFKLDTPEMASEFYNQIKDPDIFNKLESPEDIENLKSVKRLGSYLIFECKTDKNEYSDISKADMELTLDFMVQMYEQE